MKLCVSASVFGDTGLGWSRQCDLVRKPLFSPPSKRGFYEVGDACLAGIFYVPGSTSTRLIRLIRFDRLIRYHRNNASNWRLQRDVLLLYPAILVGCLDLGHTDSGNRVVFR